jgi:GNAT superfamily N-acetyltransferase
MSGSSHATPAPNFPDIRIRKAGMADADRFLALVDALAVYEKLAPPDADARARLVADAFGPAPRIEAFLAEHQGTPAAYAIVFPSYSSFLALPTLYLEDIFVLPAFRGKKVGLALFLALATLAKQRGCGRMEWTVLDWNRLAIDFYGRLGAAHMREWQLHRMTRADLDALPDLPLL